MAGLAPAIFFCAAPQPISIVRHPGESLEYHRLLPTAYFTTLAIQSNNLSKPLKQ